MVEVVAGEPRDQSRREPWRVGDQIAAERDSRRADRSERARERVHLSTP
ncbi:hypothetical protein [Halorussus pelagicus]|nr:hypothetical protein [Halorussus pelagicus]